MSNKDQRWKGLNARQRVVRARTQLVLKQPFYGQLAMHLQVREATPNDVGSDGHPIDTLATDGEYLLYHPDYVKALNDEELRSGVAHEVVHCALGHIWRRGDRQPFIWNIAADMTDNHILREAHFVIPKGWITAPKEIEGASTERTYAWLLQQGGCGGGGGDTPWGRIADNHSMWGKKPKDKTPQAAAARARQLEAEWRSRVAAAAAAARQTGRGTLPAGLERLVSDLLNPKVDWRAVLAQFMHSLRLDDFSWSRVRKVPMAGGKKYYAPRLQSEGIRIAVGLDTSGSISQVMLKSFLSEVAGILWSLGGVEMVLYVCDADVHAVWRLGPDDPIPKNVPGGGGTDFRPVFARVEKDFPEPPDALVFFTDTDGAFPAEAPEYPVLWIVDEDPRKYEVPFGQIVEFDAHEEASA